jgi:hypothetical protein
MRFTNFLALANSAQTAKIDFSSPVREPRVTFSQITGEGRLKTALQFDFQ